MPKLHPLAWLALAAVLVLLLRMLESRWPQLSWLLFFSLTLSLGFAHGVLDIVLLRHALPRPRVLAHFSLYGVAVIIVLVAAWRLPALALLVLLLLSVWHFGQELHPLRLARLALGGAAVMWPMIVQPIQMQTLLTQAFPQAAWLMLAWQALAWVWLQCLLVAIARHWSATAVRNRLLLESAGLALMYSLLSPWLAFALYFSLFHSAAHIRRVWQASFAAGVSWPEQRTGLLLTALLTTALIATCAWIFVPQVQWINLMQSAWALPAWVALVTAVTVPHGLLVGLAWAWLQTAKRY